MKITDKIKGLAAVDIFKEAKSDDNFVGRPFHLDYSRASILVADSWKNKVHGIPQGSFLLAFYENEKEISEAILLRAIGPTPLPTDSGVTGSMIEYYKDNLKTSEPGSDLDVETKYEFSFSGLECRTLGTFYKDQGGKIVFGADIENFYSAHNYTIFKPIGEALEVIANFRDGKTVPGNQVDVSIGHVRYSSSLRFQENLGKVPVYVNPKDFLGKRTALFGMTRTGKSNTIKKIIEATVKVSKKATLNLQKANESAENKLEPFNDTGVPKYGVGQIIFDINGEYANANLQDAGTAIFELFKKETVRYSVIEKEGFKIMKVNFFNEIEAGFGLICNHFRQNKSDTTDYVGSFMAVNLEKPDDYDTDFSSKTRYDRKVAAYLCCLKMAGFRVPHNFKVSFKGNKSLNNKVREENIIEPSKGVFLDDAVTWFTSIWENYEDWDFFSKYKNKKGRPWIDEELSAILTFLTRKKRPKGALLSGYSKMKPLIDLHTSKADKPFEASILEQLRKGKIIIIDLSQGNPDIQKIYSERICMGIFQDSMNRFVENEPNNFIQLYFEEAHNLFPQREDKDLSKIYNRLAKEGAKLNLGVIYSTQEVSSISANILKNTQNWFIAHLNNEEEIREIRKYYDFQDFAESLIRFSASSDQGFVRMKTYSNPFVVPVQIDRFIMSEK